ncbi:hypothetical protein [Paraburkholderia phenazinium]|uniref:hypothetical protein n=1 Tax=Paraburkholderia phenazinium TaxID=60549 RepID=UPI00115FBF20|nr:hypothetical protein [Paraburkholderia phenazinium]
MTGWSDRPTHLALSPVAVYEHIGRRVLFVPARASALKWELPHWNPNCRVEHQSQTYSTHGVRRARVGYRLHYQINYPIPDHMDKTSLIEQFTQSVTVPIIFDHAEKGSATYASGSLFEIGGRYFLITARHIFEPLSDEYRRQLAYPGDRRGGALYTFGNFDLCLPTEEHIDVAAMELKSPETIGQLKKGWQFLSLANVGRPEMANPGAEYLLAGYPSDDEKHAWVREGNIKGRFLQAYSHMLPQAPAHAEKPVVKELDLFFDYAKTASEKRSGNQVQTPDLRGTSGCSVWQFVESDNKVWTAESNMRVIGIQSGFLHTEFFRAKNWWAVAKVLEQVDASLAEEMRETLERL